MNKVWEEEKTLKHSHVQKMVNGQDENFRERLELNADAKDEIQISPVGETFVK